MKEVKVTIKQAGSTINIECTPSAEATNVDAVKAATEILNRIVADMLFSSSENISASTSVTATLTDEH